MKRKITSILFDLGGVLIESPGKFIADYEFKERLPPNTLKRTIVEGGSEGIWAKLERGELKMDENFARGFCEECYLTTNIKINKNSLLEHIIKYFTQNKPIKITVEKVKSLRNLGLKTGILTNNFLFSDSSTHIPVDSNLFNIIIESARVGMRKPEERIYKYALERLAETKAENVVFLDDLYQNLIPAKNMNFNIIHFKNPLDSIEQLDKLIGKFKN